MTDEENSALNEAMKAEARRIKSEAGLDMVLILYMHQNDNGNEVLGMAKSGADSAAAYAARWYTLSDDKELAG